MSDALRHLNTALGSNSPTHVLSAAWATFDVVGQLADDITWTAGTDEFKAMIAAQACSTARSALPLPQADRTPGMSTPDPGAPLDPYVELLNRTGMALAALAARDGVSDEDRVRLTDTVGQAELAAAALANVRER
ncbi:hypothetical protein ACIOEX_02365 [Streptomyces sp. NPDC087850]|uniref:hypothetical protein n=1 Tax=Streptomyces sp. NPDC087850 TaxID=3365809 RepID=UPI0037F5D8CC